MSQVTMLKKLGAKQITGDVKKVVRDHCANDGDRLTLYSIFGVVNGMKTGTHTLYGDFCAFMGQVEAVNHVTGEAFASNQVFIPEPLETMVKAALVDSDKVEFAITVDVKRRDDLGQGYEYLPIPHIKTQENDPIAHLRSAIPQIAAPNKLAIAAPDVEPEAVPAKAPAKGKK